MNNWEKRWHPLRQEWIVYAAHRNSRPWSGASVKTTDEAPSYDPNCYLCPGNTRIHNDKNPDYQDVFIFDNDHPVVGAESPEIESQRKSAHDGLYITEKAEGIAKVICYDPRHNVTLSDVNVSQVAAVFRAWRGEMEKFQLNPKIKSALIFENKGQVVGVSNPHPHCQIYATDFEFQFVKIEMQAADEYKKKTGKNLFDDIIKAEQKDGIRIISENEYAIAFIPFFARFAYEVLIFPKKKHATLITMSDEEILGMAQVYQEVARRYDLNYNMSFPYVLVFFQAPVDGKEYPEFHMHIHILPPLRQPGLIKFLAGPELGAGNFMADTMPEDKAAELRKVDLSLFEEAK